MNKIEIGLGVSVLLLSLLAILLIQFSVVPSTEYPGRYTYGSSWGELLLLFLSVEGFAIALHGAYPRRFLELGLGFFVSVWGFLAMMWVGFNIYDGMTPFIKSFPTNVIETWLSILPGILLGALIVFDGLRQHSRIDDSKLLRD